MPNRALIGINSRTTASVAILVRIVGCIVITGFFATVFGCTSLSAKKNDAGNNSTNFMQAIKSGMNSCSQRIDYNPDAIIGETSLGKNERAWRTCVYQVIEEKIIPKTHVPDLYKELIAEDQAMTDAIQDGRLTRSQRHNRLEQLADEISAAEAAQVVASDPAVKEAEAAKKAEFVHRMVNGLR